MSSLIRHANTFGKGKPKINCPEKEVKKPLSTFERAFNSFGPASGAAIRWLEEESCLYGKQIHHTRCGHGGEREIAGAPVDGYEPTAKTVFQFHGCYYHGCPNHCFRPDRKELFEKTLNRDQEIRDAGYKLVLMWECEQQNKTPRPPYPPKPINKSYPHHIGYDFESFKNLMKQRSPTKDLCYEDEHVPISFSVSDTLNKEPTHCCNKDPKDLIKDFVDELMRRQEEIVAVVTKEFIPDDFDLVSPKNRAAMLQWVQQVPVLGFNSGRYDLNLIKQYFVEELSSTTNKVNVGARGRQTMFINTPQLNFLDLMNYLGPGTPLSKFITTYGCKDEKSWFPYEWMDSPDKLDYPGLPEMKHWYTSMKPKNKQITKKEYAKCQKVFAKQNMKRLADWLRYYLTA